MQNNTESVTVYITYLQLAYILQADVLKFDFKLTNKKIINECKYMKQDLSSI